MRPSLSIAIFPGPTPNENQPTASDPATSQW
jgi:hypothetical protein